MSNSSSEINKLTDKIVESAEKVSDKLSDSTIEVADRLVNSNEDVADRLLKSNEEAEIIAAIRFSQGKKISYISIAINSLTFLVLLLFCVAFFRYAIIIRE